MRAHQAAPLRVPFLDLADSFTHTDGSLRAGLFAGDGLHLAPAGSAAWAEAVEAWIADALR
jgi:lysophospholipase L1-like esterase